MLTSLRQMELGATRRDAFLAMAERNSSESLKSMIGATLQAEELGVPLSEALNEIAEDMRRAAHQDARRRAARAAPRVSLIVTTLIVPGAMILILMTLFLSLRRPRERAARAEPPMSERIRERGPDGSGGWLESACKLIISVRAGILLVTLLSLPDQDERTRGDRRDRRRGRGVVRAAAVLGRGSAPALVRHPA